MSSDPPLQDDREPRRGAPRRTFDWPSVLGLISIMIFIYWFVRHYAAAIS